MATGAVAAALTAAVVIGGVRRIATVAGAVVPSMALLYVGIALWALGSLVALPELHRAYAALGAGRSFGALTAIRFALCLPVLLPPTIAMGATLPVLVRATSEWRRALPASAADDAGWGSEATWLYATNTLGAVFGAGVSGFYLLPEQGARVSLIVAAATSLLAAVIVVVSQRLAAPGWSMRPARRDTRQKALAREIVTDGSLALSLRVRGACAAGLAAGAGSASLAGEVLWTRVLRTIVQGTTQAFAAMLVNYLLGIGLGALLAEGVAAPAAQPPVAAEGAGEAVRDGEAPCRG